MSLKIVTVKRLTNKKEQMSPNSLRESISKKGDPEYLKKKEQKAFELAMKKAQDKERSQQEEMYGLADKHETVNYSDII